MVDVCSVALLVTEVFQFSTALGEITMNQRKALLSAIAAAVFFLPSANAAPEFAAVMVQKAPNQKARTANLFVGPGGLIRSEYGSGEQKRISIVDPERGISWMLNPHIKEFVEFRGQNKSGTARPALPGDAASPCNKPNGPRCQKVGDANVAGRKTEKWEMSFKQGPQTVRSFIWIDRTLGLPIREMMPGGYVRELSNISLGRQNPSLFRVPTGYKQIAMPAPKKK